jgi:hypothetical protein
MGGRIRSKLGCASSLFLCFSTKSRAAALAVDDDIDIDIDDDRDRDDDDDDPPGNASPSPIAGGGGKSPEKKKWGTKWNRDRRKTKSRGGRKTTTTRRRKKGATTTAIDEDGDRYGIARNASRSSTALVPIRPSRRNGSIVGSVQSGRSHRSSVYFDAIDESWHSLGGESFDDNFVTLHLDGQYYFDAMADDVYDDDGGGGGRRDDGTTGGAGAGGGQDVVDDGTYEGIHMYPRLPTTAITPLPDSPISTTNMNTLLGSYQHRDDDSVARLLYDEADVAAGMAGDAMERQAKRLMTVDEGRNSIYLVDSTNLLLNELKVPSIVREKGFPGELTDAELKAVKSLQMELNIRDPIYGEIVRALSSVEKEAYALCRFLRARKFDVEKVFALLDEAKECYARARDNDFYPDLEGAMGVSRSVFLSQYPAVFYGK